MRLAIAEDSGLFRSSLTLLLEASGAEITAGVASGTQLLAAVGANQPDAVILDIRMPPTFSDEGISTAAELHRLYPGIGILVLSTYAESSYASQLLETVPTGVGYLLKDNVTDAGTLLDSLDRIVDGGTVIDPTIVRRLLQRNRKQSKIDSLNEREHTVLRYMAEGRSNLGIAKELFLSPRTVEAHVTSIFLKLGLDQAETDNNRVRAVLTYLRSADAESLRSPDRLGRRSAARLPPLWRKPSAPARLFKDDHIFLPESHSKILTEPTYSEGRDDFTMSLRSYAGGWR